MVHALEAMLPRKKRTYRRKLLRKATAQGQLERKKLVQFHLLLLLCAWTAT